MRIEVEVEEIEGDYAPVPSVRVKCTRCDHEVEVFGTSDRSVKRGCLMLREECPNGESNYYAAPEED